jgi:hypothetical protein
MKEKSEENDAWFDLEVEDIGSNDTMEMKIIVKFHLIQTMKILLLLDQRKLIILFLPMIYQFEPFVFSDDLTLH